MAEAGAGASAAVFENGVEVGAGTLESRDQAEYDAGDDGNKNRKAQNSPVHSDQRPVQSDARKTGRVDRHEGANPGETENQPQHASGQGKHDALGEQLPDNPAASGADRRPDGDLASPSRGSRQQQIGDVGTGDQQDEADRA